MVESSATLTYAEDGSGSRNTFVAPYLVRLVVADQPYASSHRVSMAEVSRVRIGRGDDFEVERSHDGNDANLRIAVPDGWMSTSHAELWREGGDWLVKDSGSKNGCYINALRCEQATLCDGDLIHTGNTTFLFRSSVERSHLDPADANAGEMLQDPAAAQTLYLPLARVMADLARVASSTVSVILGGASGTGKEVSARYVHECSGRQGQFIAVNCGALPSTLVESELFGHRKGAFSGAQNDRVGLVQAADGGTLFLDEIAELPLEAQVKLLRVLQEREVLPLGATRPIPVNLRVIAATHTDLKGLVESGGFRADLYARLSGVCLRLPSLEERREDIGILIAAILRRCAVEREIAFEREAVWALALYRWPLNIRELEQALTAAVAWSAGGTIEPGHLPPAVARVLTPNEPDEDEVLRGQLRNALRQHRGNVSATARELGKARVQIRRWCKRLGLVPGDFR